MDKLIVFIADKKYLEHADGLFHGTNSQTFHEVDLYQKKDEPIYGVECLKRGNVLDPSQKLQRLHNIFKAILSSLEKEGKNHKEVKEIIVFSHGLDLEETIAKLKPVSKKDLKLLNSNEYEEIKDQWPWGSSQEGGIVPDLWFTAFSHENLPPVVKKLQETPGPNLLKELTQLSYNLHNDWSIEKNNFNGIPFPSGLKEKLEGFNVDVLFFEKNEFIDSAPSHYQWLEQFAIQFPDYEKNSQKPLLRLVFFPYHAITEAEDLNFYEKVFGHYYPKMIDDSAQNDADYAPILFMGFWDIMEKETDQNVLLSKPDPRFRFLDSSIWYRYVALESKNFSENLSNVLDTFKWAYEHDLYKSNVCCEFLEFNNRMLLNSYIKSEFGSGHSLNVYPFTFHSETKMASKLKSLLDWMNAANRTLRWNFLLIDDFAEYQLRIGYDKPGEDASKSKGEILKNLIVKGPFGEKSFNLIEKFHTAELPEKAWQYIQGGGKPDDDKQDSTTSQNGKVEEGDAKNTSTTIYDIILLDYLFSYPDDKNKIFGTKFLDEIKNTKTKQGQSIRQNYWIYPITVFNEAIHADLQEKGYQYFDSEWHMVRGADPLNTPNLFLNTLFDFMKEQAQKIILEEEELWTFFSDAFQEKIDTDKVKSAVIKVYGRFVDRFSSDEGVPDGSALGESARQYIENSTAKELRNHMRALLFFLGYSSGFDFPVIERELFWIEDAFSRFRQGDNSDLSDKVDTALQHLSNIIYNISGKYF